LFRDNVPTIKLASWEVAARLFNGDAAAGPVPALFSEDINASLSALMENPQRAHQDMQRAMKSFFMPETVELEEALLLVKKPR
jgi:hypothetical protein